MGTEIRLKTNTHRAGENMSKREERENQILSILSEKNGVPIRKLSKMLEVSEMTIRRDLAELQSKDYISVIQGVAIMNRNQDGSSIQKIHFGIRKGTDEGEKTADRAGRRRND